MVELDCSVLRLNLVVGKMRVLLDLLFPVGVLSHSGWLPGNLVCPLFTRVSDPKTCYVIMFWVLGFGFPVPASSPLLTSYTISNSIKWRKKGANN